jgi:hypothetical protein
MVRIVPIMAGKGRLDLQLIPFRQRIPLQPVFRACAMTSHRTFFTAFAAVDFIHTHNSISICIFSSNSGASICFTYLLLSRLRPCNAARPLALRCLSFGSAVSQICPSGFRIRPIPGLLPRLFLLPVGFIIPPVFLGAAGCVPLPLTITSAPVKQVLIAGGLATLRAVVGNLRVPIRLYQPHEGRGCRCNDASSTGSTGAVQCQPVWGVSSNAHLLLFSPSERYILSQAGKAKTLPSRFFQ